MEDLIEALLSNGKGPWAIIAIVILLIAGWTLWWYTGISLF